MRPAKTRPEFRQPTNALLIAEALIVGLLLVAIVVAGLTLISMLAGAR